MTTANSLALLTVRGTVAARTLEQACKLHNETAGSPEGMAAARALGDLSHKVYTAVPGAPGADPSEVMFLDFWMTAHGIGQFFSDPQVQGMAGKLFSTRDGVVWTPARGAFSFHLPPPASKPDRYLGVIRGPVNSVENAVQTFGQTVSESLSKARQRGQISHELFVRAAMPGAPDQPEMLGVDLWCDASGMMEHYRSLQGVYSEFKGAPQTSVWQQPQGPAWSEW
jgi:hypothetical protein